MTEILVVGAGPVGLTLAAELARHGLVPRIIEKSAEPSPYCRAIGVTPRSLEVFEDMGVARELIDAGLWLEGVRLVTHGMPIRDIRPDFTDLPYSQLGVPQYATEAVLERHLSSFGVTVERGTAFTGLTQADSAVEAGLEGPKGRERATFRYVIGCDGAHSAVRRALSIGFDGDAFPMEFMLGDVRIDWGAAPLPRGMSLRAVKLMEGAPPDIFVAIPLPEPGRYRVSMQAPARLAAPAGGTGHGIQADRPGATLADLQEVADRLLPDKPILSDMRWSSMFRISMRLAAKYRLGRAFIAGDAAHIHPPTGGQGMNTGIQDAYNLAWKLALVVRGLAAESLLDSYEAERRPVAAEVVARTTEQSINLGRDKPQHRLADTQLLVSYREGPVGDELAAGDRARDVSGLRRQGIGFPIRLFDLLRGTRPVLLLPHAPDAAACAASLHRLWPGLVRVIAIAPADAAPEQPFGIEFVQDASGDFAKAYGGSAWLVRPDNYIGLHLNPWSEAAVIAYLRDTLSLR